MGTTAAPWSSRVAGAVAIREGETGEEATEADMETAAIRAEIGEVVIEEATDFVTVLRRTSGLIH